MKKLFAVLPNLHTFSTDGILQAETLKYILHAPQLRALRIRSESYLISREQLGMYRNPNLLLDFGILAQLTHLRSLVIGRLAPEETIGLAFAVHKLEGLTELSVSAIAPCHDGDMQFHYAGSCDTESPIIMFLDRLHSIRRPAKNGMQCALPQRLEHLVLRDFYRPVLSSNFPRLHDIIAPCSNLETLRISLLGIEHVKYFLSHTALPRLTDLTIGVCPHILGHTTWHALRLMFPNDGLLQPESQAPMADFARTHQHTLKRLTMTLLAGYDDPNDRSVLVLEGWRLRTLGNMNLFKD
ncbi:MAG: hypothetical protein Q9174_007495, partial [Haloplaca sp. 1 TL-2023]